MSDDSNVCFNCGEPGHWAVHCPHPKKESAGRSTPILAQIPRTILGPRSHAQNPPSPRTLIRGNSSLMVLKKQGALSQKLDNWTKVKTKMRALSTFQNPHADLNEGENGQGSLSKSPRRSSILDNANVRRDARRFSLLKADAQRQMNDDMAQAYLREILLKPPEERTPDDLNFLKGITKSLKFFEKMGPELHNDLCKVMRYDEVSGGEVVFLQGSIGKTFYVILSGTVTVHVKSTDGEEAPDENEQSQDEEGNKVMDIGRHVATIYGGESFGELALLKSTAAPRAASILAIENTEFLTIHKTDYDKTLKKIQIQALENKLLFLRSYNFFKNWEIKRLTKFSHFMKSTAYNSSETVVVRQGQVSDFVYLIFKGQCRVVYNAEVGRSDGPSSAPNTFRESSGYDDDYYDEYDEEDSEDGYYEKPTDEEMNEYLELEKNQELSMDICKPRFRVALLRQTKHYMIPQKRRMRLDLAVLGSGEMFGEGGVLRNAPQLGTMIADNNTELLVITKTDFLKRMDEKSKSMAENIWRMKNEWLQQHLEHITKMNPHGRPDQSYYLPQQASGQPKSGSKSARRHNELPSLPEELAEAMKHKVRRPRPPDQKRFDALATPRTKKPSSRNRKQLLEELATKLQEQEHALWIQKQMQQNEKSSPVKPSAIPAASRTFRKMEGFNVPSVANFDVMTPAKPTAKIPHDRSFHLPPLTQGLVSREQMEIGSDK